jgi:hypothetical protein
MTWSRFAAGAEQVTTADTYSCGEARPLRRPVGVAHAVPTPAPAERADAVCGQRVTVVGDLDWQLVWGVARCTTCQQAVGC